MPLFDPDFVLSCVEKITLTCLKPQTPLATQEQAYNDNASLGMFFWLNQKALKGVILIWR